MNRWSCCVVAGLALVACHDGARGPDLPLGLAQGPIVNGQPESGYAPVGALTAWFGSQYGGAFCTATLIRPDWVLTAAHCLADTAVSQTRFYIGSNANDPNSGTFYRALEFKTHEGYDNRYLENDIALVRLQSAVTGVTPIAYNVLNLTPYEGDDAFYVGFGAVEGINESGSGVKRSTTFPITRVYAQSFESAYAGTGTCFGDSGGPALLTIGQTLSVVGVTSAGAACEGPNCDPCQTATTSTRVDAHGPWIASKLNEPAPSCQDNAAICACAEACQVNGSCDDTVCQTSSCSAAYDCMAGCGADAPCQEQCYGNTTAEAQGQLDALFTCLENNCDPNLGQTEYSQCASSKCGAEAQACFGGGVTGSDTCEAVYTCFGTCTDQACYTTCFEAGSAQAQGEINAMMSCFDDQCATITDETAWVACVQEKCAAQITTCLGASNQRCDLAGGDCPAGKACYPTTTEGVNGCFPTAGKAVGAACDPSVNDLECVDGAACVGAGTTGVCERFCTSNAACGGGTCDFQLTGIAGVGLCGAAEVPCTDADQDGSCADADCNDQDATQHPGAVEQCGNSKDDNCNGQTDENCGNCVDADSDGFCSDVDCQDNDPTVNPGGSERCSDAIDNNCNGQTDENCDNCVDADADGYCADTDCNDTNANVHPTVAEACANAIDDNCNGQVDENCATTPAPKGGNSSSGCAGGELPIFAGLLTLGLIAARRRRARAASATGIQGTRRRERWSCNPSR